MLNHIWERISTNKFNIFIRGPSLHAVPLLFFVLYSFCIVYFTLFVLYMCWYLYSNDRSVQSYFYFEAAFWTTLCILGRFGQLYVFIEESFQTLVQSFTASSLHSKKIQKKSKFLKRNPNKIKEEIQQKFKKKFRRWCSHLQHLLSIPRIFPKPETLMLLMLFVNNNSIDTFSPFVSPVNIFHHCLQYARRWIWDFVSIVDLEYEESSKKRY